MVFGVYSKCKKNRHKNLPRPMAKRCEQGACAETMAHIPRRTAHCDEPLSPGLQPDTAPPGVRLFCRFSPGKNSAQKIEALWQCGVPGYRRRSASRFLQLNRGAKSAPLRRLSYAITASLVQSEGCRVEIGRVVFEAVAVGEAHRRDAPPICKSAGVFLQKAQGKWFSIELQGLRQFCTFRPDCLPHKR